MRDLVSVKRSYNFLDDLSLRKQGSYYIGPCPFCGGQDRFNAKVAPEGHVLWTCRNCAPGKYLSSIDYVMRRDGVSFLDAVDIISGGEEKLKCVTSLQATIQKNEYAERENIRQHQIDQRLADLTTSEIWEALHRRLEGENRKWWRDNGVPDDWQDYLSLGYTPDKPFYGQNRQLLHSPAYTIPYFHHAGGVERQFINMQYRLVNPERPNDKYRFEAGLRTGYYHVTPTAPIGDQVVVCEGAKKAIVLYVYGEMKGITVLAVPSKTDDGGVIEAVKNAGRVWYILDPDASQRSFALAKSTGRSARVVEIPMKVDDGILAGMITKERLISFFKQAVKV